MKLYQAIAQNARLLSDQQHKQQAEVRQERILALLPKGSGFDNGTTIHQVNSEKLVFKTAFHHMDANGFYDGWTEHTVTITATLTTEFKVCVSGRDKNGIKDYIAEVFSGLMYSEFAWNNDAAKEITAGMPDFDAVARAFFGPGVEVHDVTDPVSPIQYKD